MIADRVRAELYSAAEDVLLSLYSTNTGSSIAVILTPTAAVNLVDAIAVAIETGRQLRDATAIEAAAD